MVAVYRDREGADPELLQVLPGGIGPEGLLAIPSRNLFVTATDGDNGIRRQRQRARFRHRLCLFTSQPDGMRRGTLAAQRGFIDMRGNDGVWNHPDPGKQIEPARAGGSKDEPRHRDPLYLKR